MSLLASNHSAKKQKPLPEQELVLKSIFLDQSYWTEWKSKFDIAQINPETYRLLPALYKILEQSNDNALNTLSGIYKRNYTNSQLKLHKSLSVIEILEEIKVKTIIVGNTAFALHPLLNFGSTIIEEINILIEKNNLSRALRSLDKYGWGTNIRLKALGIYKYRFEIPFWNGSNGSKVILQSRSFRPRSRSNKILSQFIMNNPTTTKFENKQILIPSDQALLLHSILHGPGDPFLKTEWISNTLRLGNAINWQVNWQELYKLANDSNNLTSFCSSLSYLRTEMKINAIPEGMTKCL